MPYTSRSGPLQRHFSTFPAGWPGLGLLIIRVGLGVTAALLASGILGQVEVPVSAVAVAALTAVCGVAVAAGVLTPIAGMLLAVAFGAMLAAPLPPATLTLPAVVHLATDAIALALLGPGAYSLDARWFGRREVLLSPPHP